MKKFRQLFSIVLIGVVITALLGAWVNRVNIYDWYRLRNYTPPPEIVALADNTTMTDSARRLFYVNQPTIANEDEFLAACSQESAIVLGCYIQNQGIYIYDITDTRLEGVEEVTAAHELLHAAYDRLNAEERLRIDALTQQTYANLTNERVRKNVENYRKQDPTVVVNELHSILPTEVADLPAELEQYYRQYFSNRAQIVAYSEGYEKEFDTRRTKFDSISTQLQELKTTIDKKQNDLTFDYAVLTEEKKRIDSILNSGNIASYNASVAEFNQKVNAYNSSARSLQASIDTYNELVAQAKSLQVEINDLVDAIDSRPQTF